MADICAAYFSDVLWTTYLGLGITFSVLAFNFILRTIIIKLITWVGYDTHSETLARVTNGVFIAQFFNTGLLLVLVNANLSEHPIPLLASWLRGPFYDYMPRWYVDVGYKLVQTMLINSILPYVTVGKLIAMAFVKRMLDSGCTGDPYRTKKCSM